MNVSSVGGYFAQPSISYYDAAKFGMSLRTFDIYLLQLLICLFYYTSQRWKDLQNHSERKCLQSGTFKLL